MNRDISWVMPLMPARWVANARGPTEFDCWGLVCHVYKTQFAITLPEYLEIQPDERVRVAKAMTTDTGAPPWQRVDKPAHGDLVGLSGNKAVHHVGVFLDVDGGAVLHISSSSGVRCQRLNQLKHLGFHNIQFFRHDKLRDRR